MQSVKPGRSRQWLPAISLFLQKVSARVALTKHPQNAEAQELLVIKTWDLEFVGNNPARAIRRARETTRLPVVFACIHAIVTRAELRVYYTANIDRTSNHHAAHFGD